MSTRILHALTRGEPTDAATLYGGKYYGSASQRIKEKKLNEVMDNYVKKTRKKEAIRSYQEMLGRGK